MREAPERQCGASRKATSVARLALVPATASEIEYQPLALAPRDTHHHHLVRSLLLRAQHRIAVVRRTFEHARFARPAHALEAAVLHLDAGVEQGLQQRLLRLDDDGAPAAAQLGAVGGLRLGR